MHIQLSICCRCDSLRKPLFHKLISKNVMLVVYINKMHFTAEHKVVHNVEISFNIEGFVERWTWSRYMEPWH